MRICDNDETQEQLLYKDLNKGDVFSWVNLNNRGGAIKSYMGHTYFDNGEQHIQTTKKKEEAVIRYPNACICLGDPE